MEAPASAAEEAANSSQPELIKIKVKTLGQASYDLEVESDALIKDVKSQLTQVSNISASHQRLVFRGRVLKDNQRLSAYNVVDASVVHLVTRPVDTSQQPPQPSQRDRLPNGGAGQFTANMMGAQGMGVPMDMNDFGSFIASMLHTMGIQGAVHVTHTTVPSDAAGTASPEQVAQAVAEQISQQARQQNAEAGGEAPVPLLSALRTYMQRLNAMYEGDASARFLNLPPIATGGTTVFNVHQYAAAAREFIGEWEGPDEVRQFIASSAEPSFSHWQTQADPSAEAQQTPTAPAAAQGEATEGQDGGSSQPAASAAQPTPAPAAERPSRLAEAAQAAEGAARASETAARAMQDVAAQAAAMAAQRDPRRNGMDNPFGDSDPLHPSLARLTEIAMHQLMRETARHLQAQAIPRIIQNRVDLQGPLQQERLFTNEELEGLAQALHAEGTLLLETARAVSAYLLAQRNNSPAPLLSATAYHLRPDGSAPANTVPAALSNRRLTQDRRNAIFLNGRPADAAGNAAGAGQAAGVGGRPPHTGTTARRGAFRGQVGGRGTANAGRGAGNAQQAPFVLSRGSMALPFQAIQAMMGGSAQIPIGGRMLRINEQTEDQGNTMSIQIDEGDAVTVSLEPLVQAFENVFSHIPGIEQLLGPLGPGAANAPPTAASPQGATSTGAAPSGSAAPAAAGSTAAGGAAAPTSLPAATSATPEQQGRDQSFSAHLPGIMQQVIPMFLSMMAATGQGGTPGTAGQAAGAAPNAQRGAQDGTQRFTLPPFIMGPDNEVLVDIQAIMQGGSAAAQEAMGPILDGLMFSMGQAGFPMAPASGGPQGDRGAPNDMPPQHPLQPESRRAQSAAADRAQGGRRRPGEHPLAEESDDDDDDDDDISGLMRDSDPELNLNGDSDEHSSQAESEPYSDYEEDDDDDEADDSDGDSDVPGLVDDEESSDGKDVDRSEGWQTAEEESEDEAERRGGSDHGRRVRSRRDSPSPKEDMAAQEERPDEVTKVQEKQAATTATAAPSAPPAPSNSIPVPAPHARAGPQSWPLSAEHFDDSVSPAASPSPSAPIGLLPLPQRPGPPPAVLGTGLALPQRGVRGRGRGRGGRSTTAGRGSSMPGQTASAAAGTASTAPPASSAPLDTNRAAGVEEISRQAGSRTAPGFPPEIDSLMSELFGGGAGRGAPAGGAPRSARGPGAGGLMDILQSPALQQMFGGGPGAPVSAAPVSGAPSAAPAGMGPGGLMGMVSQLAQSPAMQQMAEQLAGRMDAGGDQSAPSLGGRSPGARGEAAPPDFGSFLQQMLPMVGQMLGGAPEAPSSESTGRALSGQATDSGDEFAALNALPPAEASHWRETILADRRAQADRPAAALSSTYLAGSRSARSAEG